jgi:hypothetical protein
VLCGTQGERHREVDQQGEVHGLPQVAGDKGDLFTSERLAKTN